MKLLGVGAVIMIASAAASAENAAETIAKVLCSLVPEVISLSYALAFAVFLYGGAKYAYSADDPGGRKQGKSIAVNALIGFIIVGASQAVVKAIASGAEFCTFD